MRGVAEALFFHLAGRRAESSGAVVVHGEKTEGLSERDAIGAGLQEFDLGGNFPKHRIQNHLSHNASLDRTLGENSRSSRQ